MIIKYCVCGSQKNSWWEIDARGIPLARVCVDCKEEKLKKFKPSVLTDSQYQTDEPVDPE